MSRKPLMGEMFDALKADNHLIYNKLIGKIVKLEEIHDCLDWAAHFGRAGVVDGILMDSKEKQLISSNLTSTALISTALRSAASEGHLDIIRSVLSKHELGDSSMSEVICSAINGQHLEVVRFLLPYLKDEEVEDPVLRNACIMGGRYILESILDLCMDRSIVIKNQNGMLEGAVVSRSVDNLKLVLNYMKPTKEDGALWYAMNDSNYEMIDLLYDLTDLDITKKRIDNQDQKKDGMIYFLQKYESQNTKKTLTKEIVYKNSLYRKNRII